MKLPKLSMEMMLYLADEKAEREKHSAEMDIMREGILIGLLIDIGDVFNVPLETIQSGDRQELTVFVRTLFYFIARGKTHFGMKHLTKVAGRKDHTGCIHHARKIKALFAVQNSEFITLWNYYLTYSKLFTSKDFING